MYVKNLTCVNTAGIAIGSLGQYEGEFDLVENITAEDVTVRPNLAPVGDFWTKLRYSVAHRKP